MAALDAFGRLRVAGCFTTFNYYPSPLSAMTTLDIDVFISKQNGGTQTYDSQKAIPINDDFRYEIYHITTGEEEGIYANGILTESYNLELNIKK